MDGLTIGQLAQRAGVGIETIRFYEREGLLPSPPRTRAGYRKYPEQTVERLGFIQRAKVLGFTLAEIQDLLVLRGSQDLPAEEVRARAEAKIANIEAKVRDLEQMRAELLELTRLCANGDDSGCAILEALSGAEHEE